MSCQCLSAVLRKKKKLHEKGVKLLTVGVFQLPWSQSSLRLNYAPVVYVCVERMILPDDLFGDAEARPLRPRGDVERLSFPAGLVDASR